MLLGLAQPALTHHHHAQVVVSQLEVRVQAHRPGECLFRPFQIARDEIGHSQVVEKRRSVGLQFGGGQE